MERRGPIEQCQKEIYIVSLEIFWTTLGFSILWKVFLVKPEEICEAAALTILLHFELVDPHYTYTLPQSDNIPIEEDNNDDNFDEAAQVSEEITDDQPRFVSVT